MDIALGNQESHNNYHSKQAVRDTRHENSNYFNLRALSLAIKYFIILKSFPMESSPKGNSVYNSFEDSGRDRNYNIIKTDIRILIGQQTATTKVSLEIFIL